MFQKIYESFQKYFYVLAISENKRGPLILSHWQHIISQALRHVAAPRVLFWDYVSKSIVVFGFYLDV
jgi:hypothetical protein